jgi:hypothetical protein
MRRILVPSVKSGLPRAGRLGNAGSVPPLGDS